MSNAMAKTLKSLGVTSSVPPISPVKPVFMCLTETGGLQGAALREMRAENEALKAEGPLFRTVSGKAIYHGDDFWCFYEGQKQSANRMTANRKFDYNDGEPRFADKTEAQEAIRVYAWLNGPYE